MSTSAILWSLRWRHPISHQFILVRVLNLRCSYTKEFSVIEEFFGEAGFLTTPLRIESSIFFSE